MKNAFPTYVGNAALSSSGAVDGVVGSIGVGHQKPVELVAQKAFGRLGAAVRIDAEDGKQFVAGIPEPTFPPILPPVGLIGMDQIGDANLFDQILVDGPGVALRPLLEAQGAGGNKIDSEKGRF